MKCGICDKEIVFKNDEDRKFGMVLNAKTLDRFCHGKCYEDKLGTDALDEIHKAVTP